LACGRAESTIVGGRVGFARRSCAKIAPSRAEIGSRTGMDRFGAVPVYVPGRSYAHTRLNRAMAGIMPLTL
jgi:hypothetical protein